jgi:hypothetical protein
MIEARSIKESKSIEAIIEANKHLVIIQATKYRSSSITQREEMSERAGEQNQTTNFRID